MIDISDGIFKLYPQVTVINGTTAYDANGNIVEYDKAAVEAYVAANEYKSKRAAEYPSLAEFADAYYWAQNGDNTKMTAYIEKCDEVKSKYPKGTA
jgi:hypothetical protein